MAFLFLSNFIYLFIFDCAGSSLPRGLFSSCGEWGLLSSCGAQTSHCSGFSCCRARDLGCVGSLVGRELSSYSAACGIFLDRDLTCDACPQICSCQHFRFCHCSLLLWEHERVSVYDRCHTRARGLGFKPRLYNV